MYSRLRRTRKFVSRSELRAVCELTNTSNELYDVEVSVDTFGVLEDSNGSRTVAELRARRDADEETGRAIVEELLDLWSRRAIFLHP